MQIIPIAKRCCWKYLSMHSFFKYSCCVYDKLTDCFFCQNLIVAMSSFIESVLPLLKMVGSQLTHLRWLFYFSKSIRVSNDIIPHVNIDLHIAQPWKPEVLWRDPRWPAVSQVDLTQVVQHTLLLQVPSKKPLNPKTVSLFGQYGVNLCLVENIGFL